MLYLMDNCHKLGSFGALELIFKVEKWKRRTGYKEFGERFGESSMIK